MSDVHLKEKHRLESLLPFNGGKMAANKDIMPCMELQLLSIEYDICET
jgi:hypothetical protein